MKNFINPKNWLPKMFGTTIILANIKFILFIVLLAVIYIFNGHQNNKVVRGIKTTATEVKDKGLHCFLRWNVNGNKIGH